MSDVGSYAPATSLAGNDPPPYFGGKFTTNETSNDAPDTNILGNVWVEDLSASLGITITPAEVGFNGSSVKCPIAAIPALASSCTSYGQRGSRVTSAMGVGHNADGTGALTVPVVTQIANHLARFTSFEPTDLIFVCRTVRSRSSCHPMSLLGACQAEGGSYTGRIRPKPQRSHVESGECGAGRGMRGGGLDARKGRQPARQRRLRGFVEPDRDSHRMVQHRRLERCAHVQRHPMQPVYEGLRFYDLGAHNNGVASIGEGLGQTFASLIGATYRLTFGLSGENLGSSVETVRVTAGDALMDFALTPTGTGVFTRAFNAETFLFNATAATTTLSFVLQAIAGSPGNNDPMFDAVSVELVSVPVVPVPEPESWALMLAGLGVVGALQRRRTRP